MIPRLSARLSRFLLDRAGGHRAKVLQSFARRREADFFPRDMQDRLVVQQIARLLTYCRGHVPRLKGSGPVTPGGAIEQLRALELMRREDIQREPDAFRSDEAAPTFDDATGGSTGTPMVFKVDRQTQIARESSLMWADSLAGWAPGEKIAMLWGSARDVQGAGRSARLALRWWIENRQWYSAFEMGDEQMLRFDADLRRFRPHLLVAYASAAATLARFVKGRGGPPGYPLKAIVSSAEVLTPEMRAEVEAAFGRPVFDRYGNREFGAMAAECEAHAGLHLNESDLFVEVDSPDPVRTPGPVLVTYLHNFAMPFVRYDTGDLAILTAEPCSCGRTTKRLLRVVGRRSDMIRTADGRRIHGEFFTHLLYRAPGVRQFQFIQEKLQRYRLILAADRRNAEPMEAQWKAQILDAVGGGAELTVEYVEQIPVPASGKHRFTISRLPST
jgi:phenylacetate-CoA ligase